MHLNDISDQVYKCALDHGFTETTENVGQKLLLVVEEIVEAHGELRTGRAPTEVYYNYAQDGNATRMIEKPEGFPMELADALIRILNIMKGHGIDPEQAVLLKHNYNLTRPFKHGKSF